MSAVVSIHAHPSCRFYVSIDGFPRAVFAEASGLSIETAVEDVEEGGQNDTVHRLPGRTKMGNLSLKRGITTSNEFLKWSLQTAQGTITRRNLSVVMYKTDGTELMRWDYLKAYPVKWTGPSLKADDAATAIESLELAHEGLKLG